MEKAATKDDAKESDGEWARKYGIRIYTDGSAVDGGVGAAAVLIRPRSRRPKVLKLHLGSVDEHTVYEGEIIGTVLGAELLRAERRTPRLPSIALDSTAALQASEITRPRPGHYLTDLFHDRLEAAKKAHEAMEEVVMRWVPGHMEVYGNELADEEAKKAARGECSATASLPARLRKSLPCSVTAAKRAHLERLRKEAASRWKGSARGRRLHAIDPSLPGQSFLKQASRASSSVPSSSCALDTPAP